MPLDEQIPEYQGWQAGNRSVQTDGVVFGVKLIQVGCKFFDGIELKTLQMLRQDGMKAFYMAVLLWRIGMSKHLIEMVFREEILNHFGYELRAIVVSDLYSESLPEQVHWL